jgi:Lrp/AsnC family transcriptional regulator, leucine-responsive regulatory protein
MIQDETDVKILEILQREGRTRHTELADVVGLSLPAVSERLKKLEESGIITGYYAKLNHHMLGKDVTAFVLVTVDSSRHYTTFLEHASNTSEILECHAVTGEGTHLIKIRTDNTMELERLLTKIKSWQGVVMTTTSIVLSTSKESTQIKIHFEAEQFEKSHHDSKSKESVKSDRIQFLTQAKRTQ